MRVRETQLTEMLDNRNNEVEDLNLQNRKLEKKLRKSQIKDKDQELYADELIQEIEDLRESYRQLQEQFDNVNTSRLGKAISDKSIDNILKHTVSHTEFELQKENDFLHMRL